MAELKSLFNIIDQLSPEDLDLIYQYVKRRRQAVSPLAATGTFQAVPDRSTTDNTIKQEVNAIIDNAITQVKKKRETQEIARH